MRSRSGRNGRAGPGSLRLGTERQQRHGRAWRGPAGHVLAGNGTAAMARRGAPGQGVVGRGMARQEQPNYRKEATQMTKNGTKEKVEEAVEVPNIVIRRLKRELHEVPIVGVTPLIVNRWSEKAKEMMLAAQQSKARAKKAPKDPVALYEASKYKLPDGRDGFPAVAFKASIVNAARQYDGVTMTQLKQCVMTLGEGPDQLVPLAYESVSMREDTVRISKTADLRYRAQYNGWSAVLRIRTVAGQFDLESLLALVDAAGIGGVGEWRPSAPNSSTGSYGCFEVRA